jgi:hypothetical protein
MLVILEDNCISKKPFFWPRMKKDVIDYIAKCIECQKLNIEHRNPTVLLQPLSILEWKWNVVTTDFITKFPKTTRQHDSVMVMVDKLTKVAHFIC